MVAEHGPPRYPRARSLLITADGGQQWRAGAPVEVGTAAAGEPYRPGHHRAHFPPGTSKWNKIEHRLFSYVSNWRGQPLVSLAVIVNLIGATRTATGLRVRCELDRGAYPKGHDVSTDQMAALNLEPHRFHGNWNYTLRPVRVRR